MTFGAEAAGARALLTLPFLLYTPGFTVTPPEDAAPLAEAAVDEAEAPACCALLSPATTSFQKCCFIRKVMHDAGFAT